jgi:hypothetical protein
MEIDGFTEIEYTGKSNQEISPGTLGNPLKLRVFRRFPRLQRMIMYTWGNSTNLGCFPETNSRIWLEKMSDGLHTRRISPIPSPAQRVFEFFIGFHGCSDSYVKESVDFGLFPGTGFPDFRGRGFKSRTHFNTFPRNRDFQELTTKPYFWRNRSPAGYPRRFRGEIQGFQSFRRISGTLLPKLTKFSGSFKETGNSRFDTFALFFFSGAYCFPCTALRKVKQNQNGLFWGICLLFWEFFRGCFLGFSGLST